MNFIQKFHNRFIKFFKKEKTNENSTKQVNTEVVEIDIETSTDSDDKVNNKRKHQDSEFYQFKKQKIDDDGLLSDGDSGYSATDDSLTDMSDTLNNTDELNSIISENIGEVNMLDDSLELFNDSIKEMDLVNDMYQKIQNEEASTAKLHSIHVKEQNVSEDKNIENMMKALLASNSDTDPKIPEQKKDLEELNDIRKVFYGPFDNREFKFQVVSIKPGFKSDLFEVELSDGKEFSNNFYFKTGSSALKINLMIKLKQLRYIGARICVESFESLEQESSMLGNPDPIEDEFFTTLRATKLDPVDIFDVSSPKTIIEYILLEENVRSFIESFGCNIEVFKFSSEELEVKKEIIFYLCRSNKKFSSKLLKVLSSQLNMERAEIEKFVEESRFKLQKTSNSLHQEHGYCNLYKTLL